MGEAFLHRCQHVFAGFDEDQAGRVQADAGEAGGEQIRPFLHPQHRPLQPRQRPGEEQRRRGTMLGIRAGAGNFVQAAQKQRAGTIEGGDAERDRPDRPGRVSMLDPRDLVAQAGERLGTLCPRRGCPNRGGGREHNRNIRPSFVRVESEISAR